MNVWIAQDTFHAICITLWSSGFNDKEWEGFFICCEIPYNKDWIQMYMKMFDEDFKQSIFLGLINNEN